VSYIVREEIHCVYIYIGERSEKYEASSLGLSNFIEPVAT